MTLWSVATPSCRCRPARWSPARRLSRYGLGLPAATFIDAFAKHFPTVNAIYAPYFPEDPPARIFVCVPEWTGPFDIEINCVAVV